MLQNAEERGKMALKPGKLEARLYRMDRNLI